MVRQWSGVAVTVDDLTKVKYVYSGDDDNDIAVTNVVIIIAYFTWDKSMHKMLLKEVYCHIPHWSHTVGLQPANVPFIAFIKWQKPPAGLFCFSKKLLREPATHNKRVPRKREPRNANPMSGGVWMIMHAWRYVADSTGLT